MNGECRVVFPQKDRDAAGAKAEDFIEVTLELDAGVREVELPAELVAALAKTSLTETFENLTYSKRKEFARQVAEAKAEETKSKRVAKVIETLKDL